MQVRDKTRGSFLLEEGEQKLLLLNSLPCLPELVMLKG